jgi:hypothetical protein
MKEARKCPQRLYKFVKWSNELFVKLFVNQKEYIYIYMLIINSLQIRTTTNVLFMYSRDCHHYARVKNIPGATPMYFPL